MTDNNTPILIDEVSSTDVYVATLELRSVGTSKHMFPSIRFSHHFSEEPDFVPYSYRAIMQIAEKIGAIVEERHIGDSDPTSQDLDELAIRDNARLSGEGDDNLH